MEPPIQLLPRIMVFPRFSFFSLHFHFLFLLLVFFSNNERPRASVDRSSVGIDFSAAQALSSLRWITPDPGAGHLIRAVRGSGRVIFFLSSMTI